MWENLRVNWGGALAPDQVVGRDVDVADLSALVDEQSVLMVGERRTGKTSVLIKFCAAPPAAARVVEKLSVEGVDSPEEFAKRLAQLAGRHIKQKPSGRLVEILDRFGITAVGPVSRETSDRVPADSWKEDLTVLVTELCNGERLTVLILDEFPHMIDNIARQQTTSDARAVLNLLRQLRQETTNLRLILCGSIGLHHVLREIRDGSWAPVNDLATFELRPLDAQSAFSLACALLRNEAIPCGTALEEVGSLIASQTNGLPFFIHGLLSALKRQNELVVTGEHVLRVVQAALDSPQDPWGFRHLEARLPDYYGSRAGAACRILDIVATEEPISFSGLANRAGIADEDLRRLLEDLQRDHYLQRESTLFRWDLPLLARAWRSLRYLGD